METFILVIIPVLWVVYSILEGIREGFMFAWKQGGEYGAKKNLHPAFAVQRGTVLLNALIPYLLTFTWWQSAMFIVGMACWFPLVHDGCYYETRLQISNGDIYPRGFFTNDNNSNAKISIKQFSGRIMLAFAGIFLYSIAATIFK